MNGCYSPLASLIEAIRRIALKGTELANAYVGTIRLKLFKIGAVILKNTRRSTFGQRLSLQGSESTRTRNNG